MQRLEVSGAVRPIYASLGFKGLKCGYFLTGRGTDTFSKRTLLGRCSFIADALETQQGAAICACHIYIHTALVRRRVEV